MCAGLEHRRFYLPSGGVGMAAILFLICGLCSAPSAQTAMEKQNTRGSGGRILTNTGVWSPDSKWIVYDTRSDAAGDRFDGETIEQVNVETGEVRVLYRSKNGSHCGVATYHPSEEKVIFILGPEDPAPDWQYNAWHRQGVIVSVNQPGQAHFLDARDITPPFTPGALRGGSHVHVWDGAGDWVSFTYEDHVLAERSSRSGGQGEFDVNARNIGVSIPGRAVRVSKTHRRNHDGEYFSVLVTRTVRNPRPGSDEVARAFEEGWVGSRGYLRPDGTRQRRALAFQGLVKGTDGSDYPEVFIADLPDDLTRAGGSPLQGTLERMPAPPLGVAQRRLTQTSNRKFPGISGVRHWVRSSWDGSQIAFLMRDNVGISQLWAVSPNGGSPRQITTNNFPIASAFTWSPDGTGIAHVMDGSVCVSQVGSGDTLRLTARAEGQAAPRPEACVFSPDGKQIAYVKRVLDSNGWNNQIFTVATGR